MPKAIPFLSVVMPVYNGQAHLTDALRSLGAPTEHEVEVIIIDDGSTDSSTDIAESFADRLPIELIRREHCGNWVAVTNYGLQRARGEYVCWLHQDDCWRPERLQRLKLALAERPPVWLVHPSRFIDRTGLDLGPWQLPFAAADSWIDCRRMHQSLCIQNFLAAPAPVVHRSLLQQVGPVDESLWYTADWDYWLKISRAAECRILHEPLSSFRVHRHSQTVQSRHRLCELKQEYERVLNRHLEPNDRQTARLAHLSAKLNVALLGGRFTAQTALPLAAAVLRTRPWDWTRFLRSSRISERIRARWALRRAAADTGEPQDGDERQAGLSERNAVPVRSNVEPQ